MGNIKRNIAEAKFVNTLNFKDSALAVQKV